jgi:hypothetical protein
MSASIWAFFYGSSINSAVLKDVDLVPDHYEVARLGGFDIRIRLLNVVSPASGLGCRVAAAVGKQLVELRLMKSGFAVVSKNRPT